MVKAEILDFFGFRSVQGGTGVIPSRPTEPYFYQMFVGAQFVEVFQGDSLVCLAKDSKSLALTRGPSKVESPEFAVLVRGFSPESKSSAITNGTVLPYINGCSSKQIFAPDRPGDPTAQLLWVPPMTKEQEHHVHSTARCIYILSGDGKSVVGPRSQPREIPLAAGQSFAIDPMSPHHFESGDQGLLVLTVHIWSTVPGAESNHPMMNGTFLIGAHQSSL